MRHLILMLALVGCFWMGAAHAGSVHFTGGVVPFFSTPTSPTGAAAAFSLTDDGRTFTFTPIDNFVGGDRWVGNDTNGITFGGGGGSTVEFEIVVSGDVELDDYIIGGGFKLQNPIMVFTDGGNPVGASGDVNVAGTFAFPGGPIMLTGGTSYIVDIVGTGAAVQSALAGFNFTPVPLPGAVVLLLSALGVVVRCRRV